MVIPILLTIDPNFQQDIQVAESQWSTVFQTLER